MSQPLGIQSRNSSMELLRILAMLLIVCHHSMIHGGLDLLAAGTSGWELFEQALHTSGKLGVAVFVMITGYYQVTARFHAVKPLLLAAQTGFYGLVLFAAAFARGTLGPMTPDLALTGVRALFGALYGDYWFVTDYLCLYLISPFLNRLIRALSRRELLALLAIGFVGASLLPTLLFVDLDGSGLGALFVLLYGIGAYLRLYPPARRASGGALVAGAAAAQLGVVLLVAVVLPGISRDSQLLAQYRLNLWLETSPLTIGIAAALVLGFSRFFFQSRLVNRVASATLGVYLLHDNAYVRPALWGHLQMGAHLVGWQIVWYAPVCVLGIYLACTLLELLRRRLIEPLYAPALARLADRLTARFNAWRSRP